MSRQVTPHVSTPIIDFPQQRDCPILSRRTTVRPPPSPRAIRTPMPESAKMPLTAEIVAWWVTSTSRPPSPGWAARNRRSSAKRPSRSAGRSKNEFSTGSSVTGPRSMSPAVSRQRHHWREYTRACAMPRPRSQSPMARACCRPSSLRLRCVAQSSRRKPSGSPMPGAGAWRISSTAPGSRRRSATASFASSGRADVAATIISSQPASPRRAAELSRPC